MTRKLKSQRASGYTILLVDDNAEYLEATRPLLEREGHRVLCAASGPAALSILRQEPIDLLLLDYYMPGMTGEQVVTELRQFNPYIQVILQTGYASEQPPREVLRRLDIQGYYDKTEGPEKLLLWTDAGLKSAYTIQMLNKSRQGLRYILDVTPDLHKIQPLESLLQGILYQVTGLLGATNSFLAVLPEGGIRIPPAAQPEGFVAILDDETELAIRASTGDFAGHKILDRLLDVERIRLIRETLQVGEIRILENVTIVPLHVGELTIGVIYLDRPAAQEQDIELLHIFANQSAVAIQNMQLYEMATLDPLTGTYTRSFLDKWLLRELRAAFRSNQPLALLIIDVDHMKRINDTAGHLTGDHALSAVGRILHEATRGSDIAARYGGDEFFVVLPQSPLEGAAHAGERILDLLHGQFLMGPGGRLPLHVSLGAGVIEAHHYTAGDIPRPIPNAYFHEAAMSLIQNTDEALYGAKREGGNRMVVGHPVQWPNFAGKTTQAEG